MNIDVDSKNFLEEVVNNYIQLPTDGKAHIKYGIQQMMNLLKDKKGKVSEKNWRAYFDFLFFDNNIEKFEKAAESYTKVLKKSPPVWRETENKEENEATNVIKIGDLSTISKARIKDFINTVQNENSYSRIDFSNTDFTKESLEGIALMQELFHEIRGYKCQILGQINLTNFLENKIKKENQENKEYWLLLLETYQCVGNKNDYENLSLDYITKFEESVLDYNEKYVLNDIEDAPKEINVFSMSKEVNKSEIIQMTYFLNEKLNQDKQIIEIDFINTQVINYNALEELSKYILNNASLMKNKTLLFKNVNQVLLTSMEIMGIDFDLISYKMIKY